MHLPDRKLAFSLVFMTLLLGAAAVYMLSSQTFFSNDLGLRFLQVRTLAEGGWQTFAVPYPARFLDPELAHVPYYYAYLLLDRQFFLKVSPYLPLLTSFLYDRFGPAALPTLPVLGGVATVLANYRLGKLTRVRHPYLLLWLTILATPVLFYSLTLWDHTLGTAGAVIAVAAVAHGLQSGRRSSFFWGGLAVALGAVQRVEIHILALALMASLLLLNWRNWMQWGAFVVGGIAGSVPIWALQMLWFGHPLAPVSAAHLLGFGVPDTYPVQPYAHVTLTRPIKISRLLLYVEAADPLIFVAALAVLVGAFLLVFVLRVPRWRKRGLAIALLVTVLAGYAIFAAIAWQRELPGLITTFPPLASTLPLRLPHGRPLSGAHDPPVAGLRRQPMGSAVPASRLPAPALSGFLHLYTLADDGRRILRADGPHPSSGADRSQRPASATKCAALVPTTRRTD